MAYHNYGVHTDATEVADRKGKKAEMNPYGDCIYCGGEVIERTEDVDYRYKGELSILRNVPAGVCAQCGERFFTAEVARRMETTVAAGRDEVSRVSVPVIETSWV